MSINRRHTSWQVWCCALVVVAAGCVDEPSPVEPTDAAESVATLDLGLEWQERVAPEDRGTRYDAPWWYMSDSELTGAAVAANGRVAVGFKDPEARGGVDGRGRVLASSQSEEEGKRFLRERGLAFDVEFELLPAVSLTLPQGREELVAEIRAHPNVDYIEPLVPGKRTAQDTTWGVWRVNAPQAWSSATGDGVEVMIIDSGVDDMHGDLDPAVIIACDGSDGTDNDGHGTLVAGVVAALDNSIDVIGVSYDTDLWSVKDGNATPDPDYTACGVESARINDVFAINISSAFDTSPTVLFDQIAAAWDEGHVIVASVGNDGDNSVGYPAAYGAVIGVTATNSSDNRPTWANYGTGVELSAPGVDIETIELGGGTDIVSGTSFSAPHVAAAAAIIKEVNPSWSNAYVRQALRGSAESLGSSTYYGYGMIDIADASGYSPMDSLTVGISGPTDILPSATCTWFASTNGTSPYSYSWYNDGGPGGTGSSSSFTTTKDSGNLTDHFTVTLVVVDAIGVTGSKEITVYEDSGASVCMI